MNWTQTKKNGKKLLSIHVYDILICMQKIYTFFLITQILHVGTVSAIIGRFYVNTSNIIIIKNQTLLCISYENIQLKINFDFIWKLAMIIFLRKVGHTKGISSLSMPQSSSGTSSTTLGVCSTRPSSGISGGVGHSGAKSGKFLRLGHN